MTFAALAFFAVAAPQPSPVGALPLVVKSALVSAVAPVTLSVDAKKGETVTGERVFRVTVTAKNPVTAVEFYVGSDLRDSDKSTPYQFTLDSVAENEGPVTLKFRAFTTEGEEGTLTLSVNVDNGTSKGLAAQLEAGQAALGDSKWDPAITAGRVALKIDPKSIEARIILARAYAGKSQFDKAQKFAEDAAEADPANTQVADILTAIRLRQAFAVVNRPGADRSELLRTISEAFKGGIDARRKSVDAAFDKVGPVTDQNLVPYADAALRSGRYGVVVNALEGPFRKDNRRTDVGNRLAYAQMRTGRLQDAINVLASVKKYGQPDAYTYSALAVALAEAGDAAGSDDAIKNALLTSADDPSVLSAQAYIALKFVRRKVADRTNFALNYDDASGLDTAAKLESRRLLAVALQSLLRDNSNRTEVLTFASALNNRLEEYTKGQTFFEQAVLADPLNADAYLEQGNRSLALSLRGTPTEEEKTQRYDAARVNFEAALAARPSSAEALAGLSIVASYQKKYADAIRWGDAATKASPSYAAGHVALATAQHLSALASRTEADRIRRSSTSSSTTNADRQANEVKARAMETESIRSTALARETTRAAAMLDRRIEGLELTSAPTAWRYFYAGGRTPLLPLPR